MIPIFTKINSILVVFMSLIFISFGGFSAPCAWRRQARYSVAQHTSGANKLDFGVLDTQPLVVQLVAVFHTVFVLFLEADPVTHPGGYISQRFQKAWRQLIAGSLDQAVELRWDRK